MTDTSDIFQQADRIASLMVKILQANPELTIDKLKAEIERGCVDDRGFPLKGR